MKTSFTPIRQTLKKLPALTLGLLGLLGVMACSSTSATPGTSAPSSAAPVRIDAATCKDVCAKIAVARCSKEDPNTCEAGCAKVASIIPSACNSDGNAYVQCASKAATWACDAEGLANPVGCDAEGSALVTCIKNNAEPATSAGGISGGGDCKKGTAAYCRTGCPGQSIGDINKCSSSTDCSDFVSQGCGYCMSDGYCGHP
ncbi:MAG TPA: hypothetical protein PLR99_05460 [Polyangiaceae bacterium]|nr:hypothetical protein [Polyangiaceae bacterium]